MIEERMVVTKTIMQKKHLTRIIAGAILVWLLLIAGTCMVHAAERKTGLNSNALKMTQGENYKLKLGKVKSKLVKWKSTNTEIATITANGVITAHKKGTCKIKASYNGKKYYCTVKVKKLKISNKALELVRYRKQKLTLSSENVSVVWSSSDTKIATVSEDGVINARFPGSCTISAETEDTTLYCKLTVLAITPETLQQTYPYKQTVAKGQKKQKTIVLAGSSSMDYWDEADEVFAGYRVVNTAIAGTTVLQWQGWTQSLITKYKPDAVVLYVGSNDLGNGGYSGQLNAKNTINLLKAIRRKQKKIPIFYVSVCPCWSRKGAWEEIDRSNNILKEYCETHKNMYFIDIATAFQAADKTPNRNLFIDQLHPNEYGYAIWKKKVGKPVKKLLKKK